MTRPSGIERRHLLGGALLAGAGLAGAGMSLPSAALAGEATTEDAAHVDVTGTIDPYGPHQAGIETPVTAFASFVSLDLRPGVDRTQIAGLMKVWSEDVVRLTAGRPALGDAEPELATVPARLTITVGYGPGLFERAGLRAQRPGWLSELPPFRGDALQKRWSGGDLLLQVTAEDPMTVSHAVRVLVTDAMATATPRWTQQGFHRPANTAPAGTGRNLMGQIDGTVNPQPGSPEFAAEVWVDDGPAWLNGGSAAVIRRITMDLALWGTLSRQAKEEAIGRRLDNGAPLTGNLETDHPDFEATDDSGLLVIPPTSHMRLAHSSDPSERLLRRPYNFDDGPGDSGLLFTAYMRNPDEQFIPIQRRLSQADVLNLWIKHVGSAVFAIPPGFTAGGWIGQGLLG